MFKKIVSIVMTLCILMSCVAIGTFSTQAASTSGLDYGFADSPQYGNILHCWNWSFNNISANMAKIADQGFSAIQTSPIQASKEYTMGTYSYYRNNWWSFYQPIGFYIEDSTLNALGTKTDFVAMCEEAHKYGIKVIVDTIFNHLSNNGSNGSIHTMVIDDLRNDSSAWHQPINQQISNYNDRYDSTQYNLSGLPDLNTSSSKVQYYATEFLKECIDAGADGFRFDAAKHIETPDDAYCASDFWPNVLNAATAHAQSTRGFTPYYYGEVLEGTGGIDISAYTKYMSITETESSTQIRNGFCSQDASSAATSGSVYGAPMNKCVLWMESHDTYAKDYDYTRTIGSDVMNRGWAFIGSRNEAAALYLARPSDWSTTKLGVADTTAWANIEVKAINNFRNHFIGQSEYISTSGSIVYNERGTSGVAIVNVNGGSTNVSLPAHTMADGTYTDAITGNTFTVSNGTITGTVGDTGIAAVYNQLPKASATPASTTYRTDTLKVTLNCADASYGLYSYDNKTFTQFNNGDQITVGSGVKVGGATKVYVKSVNDAGVESRLQTLTYTKADTSTAVDMYLNQNDYGWSEYYAYIYNESGEAAAWPGIKMYRDGDNDYMKVSVPVGFEGGNVVFNNNSGSQTPSSGGYQVPYSGSTLLTNGSMVNYVPITTTGISGNFYVNAGDWGNGVDVVAHVWNGDNEAKVKLSQVETGIYGGTLPDGEWKYVQVLRCSGNTTINKCIYYRIPEGKNYFTLKITNGNWNDVAGTWSVYGGSGELPTTATEDPNAPWYLAGSFNDWSTSATKMEASDGIATTTLELSAGSYEFKVVKDNVWYGSNYSITNTTSSSGISLNTSSGNVTLEALGGTYTFTFNSSTKSLVVTCVAAETTAPTTTTTAPTSETTESTTASTAPTTESSETTAPTSATTEATETTTEAIVTDYYLAGSFNGWSTSATPMAVTDGVATTIMTLDTGAYEFKVVDKGNWYGYDSTIYDVTDTNGVSMQSYAGNAKININGGTYKFAYNTSTKKLVVSLVTEETEPTETVVTDYYLAGSFNGWSTTDTPMAVTDGVATAKVTLSEGTYEFKVVDNGNWYGYSTAISNKTNTTGVTMKNTDGNAVLYASGGTYTFSYNTSTKRLVISYSSSSDDPYINNTDPANTDPTDSEVIVTTPKDDCGNNHSYDKGVVTKKATYFAKGKKVLTCSECGATKTVKIAKLKLKKPTVKVNGGNDTITVNYKKVKGATGFQVKCIVNGKTVTKSFNTKKAATKAINKLNAGTYKVKVRAFVKQGKKTAYSGWKTTKKVTVK